MSVDEPAIRLALVPFVLTVVLMIACGSDFNSGSDAALVEGDAGATRSRRDSPDAIQESTATLQPLPPDEPYADRSLKEWADGWVRWSTSPTDCEDNPAYDEDGSLCARYQQAESHVFMFQSGSADTVRTRCTVPAGKALLVPLIGFFVDNVGRDEPQSDRELEDEALEILMSVRDLTLRVGAQELDRPLEDWIVPPTRSDYELPSGTNVYSCAGLKDVAGKIDPSYYGGVFVLFPPPEPGTYTIEYGGAATGFGSDYVSVVRSTFVVQ